MNNREVMQQAEPPPEWPLIKNILAEYGLDAIAFVAEWKAAQQQAEPWGWYSAKADDFMSHSIRKEHERLGSYTHINGKFDLPLYTHPAATEQNPVAFYDPHKGFLWAKPTKISTPTIADVPPIALYAEPPQRKWQGLTDEDLKLLSAEWRIVYGAWMDDFARDIEAKLKEKNSD